MRRFLFIGIIILSLVSPVAFGGMDSGLNFVATPVSAGGVKAEGASHAVESAYKTLPSPNCENLRIVLKEPEQERSVDEELENSDNMTVLISNASSLQITSDNYISRIRVVGNAPGGVHFWIIANDRKLFSASYMADFVDTTFGIISKGYYKTIELRGDIFYLDLLEVECVQVTAESKSVSNVSSDGGALSQESNTDLFYVITQDIIEKEDDASSEIQTYLIDHPQVTESLIESIVLTVNNSPELLADLDKLTKESLINYQASSEFRALSYEDSPEILGLSWEDIIRWLLKYLFRSAELDVKGVESYCYDTCLSFLVTSAGILSTKVVSDLETIGYVGDGYFTWPDNSKRFRACLRSDGQHYVTVYPTIADGPRISEELRELIIQLFGDSVSVDISNGNVRISESNRTVNPSRTSQLTEPISWNGETSGTSKKQINLKLSRTLRSLESLEDKLAELSVLSKSIADYYSSTDNVGKAMCWREITMMFEALILKIGNIEAEINFIKENPTKEDLHRIKSSISDLRVSVDKTIDSIFGC